MVCFLVLLAAFVCAASSASSVEKAHKLANYPPRWDSERNHLASSEESDESGSGDEGSCGWNKLAGKASEVAHGVAHGVGNAIRNIEEAKSGAIKNAIDGAVKFEKGKLELAQHALGKLSDGLNELGKENEKHRKEHEFLYGQIEKKVHEAVGTIENKAKGIKEQVEASVQGFGDKLKEGVIKGLALGILHEGVEAIGEAEKKKKDSQETLLEELSDNKDLGDNKDLVIIIKKPEDVKPYQHVEEVIVLS